MNRIIFFFLIIFLGIVPAIISFSLDPLLNSSWHVYILGTAAVVFLFNEFFISHISRNLGLLEIPNYLTQNEKRKYREEIQRKSRDVTSYYIISISLKVLMGTSATLLATIPRESPWISFVSLVGYSTLGISLVIFTFLLISYKRIQEFKIDLEERIERERGRRRMLNEIAKFKKVQTPTPFPKPEVHRIRKS